MRIVLSFEQLTDFLNRGVLFYQGKVYGDKEMISADEFSEAIDNPYLRPIIEIEDEPYTELAAGSRPFPIDCPILITHLKNIGTYNENGIGECIARLQGFRLIPDEIKDRGLFRSFAGSIEQPAIEPDEQKELAGAQVSGELQAVEAPVAAAEVEAAAVPAVEEEAVKAKTEAKGASSTKEPIESGAAEQLELFKSDGKTKKARGKKEKGPEKKTTPKKGPAKKTKKKKARKKSEVKKTSDIK